MSEIKIAVKGNRAALLRPVDLIAGTVGQTCIVYFDENWKTYPSKIISYKVGSTILGSYKITDNTAIIPAQILATAGLPLEIGFTGRSLTGAIIPTAWCLIDTIKNGAVVYRQDSEDDYIYEGGDFDSGEENNNDIIYDGGGV